MCTRTVRMAATLAGLALAAPALASSVEIEANQHGQYEAMAGIEHSPIRVLIDTGASFVAMSFEDAEDAGLRPRSLSYDVPVNTANGLVKGARIVLDRVEVGNVVVRDVEGLVLPRGAYNGTLLGMSFLGKLDSFKFEDGRLYLRK